MTMNKDNIYKHYKGGVYTVHGIAIPMCLFDSANITHTETVLHTETNEEIVILHQGSLMFAKDTENLVIYSDTNGVKYARPAEMFFSYVVHDKKTVKRFQQIDLKHNHLEVVFAENPFRSDQYLKELINHYTKEGSGESLVKVKKYEHKAEIFTTERKIISICNMSPHHTGGLRPSVIHVDGNIRVSDYKNIIKPLSVSSTEIIFFNQN